MGFVLSCLVALALVAAASAGAALPQGSLSPERRAALVDHAAEQFLKSMVAYSYAEAFHDLVRKLEASLCEPQATWSWPLLPACCALLGAWAGQLRAHPGSYAFADDVQCAAFQGLADDFAEHALTLETEEIEGLLPVHRLMSETLFNSPCCQGYVEEHLRPTLAALAEPSVPLSHKPKNKRLWKCLEYGFWAQNWGSPYDGGVRMELWLQALDTPEKDREDYRRYAVFELLTTQFAFMPLCLHATYAFARRAAVDRQFFLTETYSNCAPTHLSYAMDHFLVAGEQYRAHETFALLQSSGLKLVDWQSIHNTAIGFFPGVSHWPWWHEHPFIRPYAQLLESMLDILEEERLNLQDHPDLQKDAFPATTADRSWKKLEFWSGDLGFLEDRCSWAPRTCEQLAALRWAPGPELVDRKLGWSIVEPGTRFAGHSGQSLRINVQMCVHGCDGAELHIGGGAFRYARGRVLAWQDGWRHEVRNLGAQARWVFMITIPHPEYEAAFEASSRDWPSTYRILSRKWQVAGPSDSLTVQPQA